LEIFQKHVRIQLHDNVRFELVRFLRYFPIMTSPCYFKHIRLKLAISIKSRQEFLKSLQIN